MDSEIAKLTSLIGDPIRTTILWALLDGRAYTATELAATAETSPQNISMHLSKLLRAEMVSVEKQGRHKYYKFSKPEVAYAIEAIANLIPNEERRKIVSDNSNTEIRFCRSCYDHLAGRVGVMITEGLLKQKLIVPDKKSYDVTKRGARFFSELHIDIDELKRQRRAFAKPCLDWSERKHHLAGSLGAALLNKLISLDYLRRTKNSRAIVVTAKGQMKFYEIFKVSI